MRLKLTLFFLELCFFLDLSKQLNFDIVILSLLDRTNINKILLSISKDLPKMA